MATESKKKLALAIVDFLKNSTTDGTLSPDESESIEIAAQCIADTFKIDPEDKAAMSDALAGQSLLAIYNVFEKMKGKSTPKPATPPTGPKQPSEGELAEAEALKNKGNAAMSQNDYHTAIDFYTQALKIIPTSPIYLSNRAAAYINVEEYDAAIRDAEIAVDTDPSYGKAWSRLGLARSKKGDNRGAMEAYKTGIDADGNGGSKALRDGYKATKEKVDKEEEVSNKTAPGVPGGFGGLEKLLGGMGGMGGPDGAAPDMPFDINQLDINQLLNNKGLLEAAMKSPIVKSILGGDGGAPDMNKISQFLAMMGSGGPGGSAGAGSGSGSNR